MGNLSISQDNTKSNNSTKNENEEGNANHQEATHTRPFLHLKTPICPPNPQNKHDHFFRANIRVDEIVMLHGYELDYLLTFIPREHLGVYYKHIVNAITGERASPFRRPPSPQLVERVQLMALEVAQHITTWKMWKNWFLYTLFLQKNHPWINSEQFRRLFAKSITRLSACDCETACKDGLNYAVNNIKHRNNKHNWTFRPALISCFRSAMKNPFAGIDCDHLALLAMSSSERRLYWMWKRHDENTKRLHRIILRELAPFLCADVCRFILLPMVVA